mmetsp:Transcript_12477/g.29488  ORF Transcript_12477/g.29488 Transcript_12477/m.29488 type:complete len:376 (+) Transcript_12477:267-1394(+)
MVSGGRVLLLFGLCALSQMATSFVCPPLLSSGILPSLLSSKTFPLPRVPLRSTQTIPPLSMLLSPQRAVSHRKRSPSSLLVMADTQAAQGIEFDENDLKGMKVVELKMLCEDYGVAKSGKKAEIIDRLLEAQQMMMGYADVVEEEVDKGPPLSPEEQEEKAELEKNIDMASSAAATFLAGSSSPAEGTDRFTAQTRTGNCWHGLYFELEAKDKDIVITSINTASSPEVHVGPLREDRMNLVFYTRDGTCVGNEKNQDGWTMLGRERDIQLPAVAYGELEASYGPLPMGQSPLRVAAGTRRGFCVFSSSWRGVVLRSKLGDRFVPGEVTDENEHLKLCAGLLPRNDQLYDDTMFTDIYSEDIANAFVGSIDYRVEP